MSRVDDLIANYRTFVGLPWQKNLAPPQRVWMAVYNPEEERRLRLHIQDFAIATEGAGYRWALIDVSDAFERWMAAHEYRDQYFAHPELMQPELLGFLDHLVEEVRAQVESLTSPDTVIALLGASSLYGLGAHVKTSALIEQIQDAVEGRLLVLFPGEVEGNNFRLLGAQDGWNYLATLITSRRG